MATITKYNKWQEQALNGAGNIDWDTDNIKVMLVNSTYTPSAAADNFINDADANEISGTNYTAGGDVITNITVTESAGTTTVNGDNVAWLQSATGFSNARYAIIYKDTGVNTTSPLVGYVDFLIDKSNVVGDLTLQWSISGIFTQA